MEALQAAAAHLRERGIRGVLVGSAALQLYGYAVEAPDADFLCETPVDTTEQYGPDRDFLGVKVQFIPVRHRGDEAYFRPERATEINGVPVAALADVIGLKRWRARPKDVEFLRGWDAWANKEVK